MNFFFINFKRIKCNVLPNTAYFKNLYKKYLLRCFMLPPESISETLEADSSIFSISSSCCWNNHPSSSRGQKARCKLNRYPVSYHILTLITSVHSTVFSPTKLLCYCHNSGLQHLLSK